MNYSICLICSAKGASLHYGAHACRACSAFFRRAISEQIQYVCRSNGNCIVHKSQKCRCKRCRLDKCFKVGMQMTAVHGKGQKQRDSHLMNPMTSQESVFEPSEFLANIWKHYEELNNIRLETEKALPLNRVFHTTGPLTGYSYGTTEFLAIVGKVHIPSIIEFISKILPEFSELSEEEKPYNTYLHLFEGARQTALRIPEHLQHTYFIVSATFYCDVNNHEGWFAIDQAPPFMKESLTKYRTEFIKKETASDKQMTLRELGRLGLSNMEVAALVAVLFWNACTYKSSEKMEEIVMRGKKRILVEMGKYYKKIGHKNPEERIGEVLTVINVLILELYRFRNSLRLFSVFDALDKTEYLYELAEIIK